MRRSLPMARTTTSSELIPIQNRTFTPWVHWPFANPLGDWFLHDLTRRRQRLDRRFASRSDAVMDATPRRRHDHSPRRTDRCPPWIGVLHVSWHFRMSQAVCLIPRARLTFESHDGVAQRRNCALSHAPLFAITL